MDSLSDVTSVGSVRRVIALVGVLAAGFAAVAADSPRFRDQNNAYTVITGSGRKSIAVRGSGRGEIVALDQLVSLFDLKVNEDPGVGLTVTAKGQRILLIPGQAFAQVNGQVISLGAPVDRDRNGWTVPIDFLSLALSRAINTRIEIRRERRLIVVGDAQAPHVTGKFTRQGAGARLEFDIDPPAAHRVTRDGKAIIVRFDADFVDADPVPGLVADFVSGVGLEGTSLRIALGPQAVSYAVTEERESHFNIDLLPPAPAAPPPPPTPVAPPPGTPPVIAGRQGLPTPTPTTQEPPAIDIAPPGAIRTIVIDPGHGGDDEGSRAAGGAKEKDIALQVARRLKATIESRWGLRVLLTREGDENVPVDKRTATANNNKADLFLSIHANASVRPNVRGAQVLTLSLDEYKDRALQQTSRPPVPVIGGGTRAIDPVPWDTAQIPFAQRSAGLAAALVQHLGEKSVPLHPRPLTQAPLRVLVGANMPAVLIEMGFLTNNEDEAFLINADHQAAIVEAILATISELRGGSTFVPPPHHP